MGWFNYVGLCVVILILIPNIVFAIKVKDGFSNSGVSKRLVIAEQIGRFGSFFFMIFNIPYMYFNFFFNGAFAVYVGVLTVLCALYIAFWIICRNKFFKFRAYALSIIPSIMFIFGGIMLLNIPLLAFSLIFAPSHIAISVKNVKNQ